MVHGHGIRLGQMIIQLCMGRIAEPYDSLRSAGKIVLERNTVLLFIFEQIIGEKKDLCCFTVNRLMA